MNFRDKQRIISRYNRRLDQFGDTIETMASGTEARRAIRFQIMTEVGMQSNDDVLDLGCGFGDFAGFLTQSDINVNYCGYDINPNLVEIASKRYPSQKFEVKDILNDNYPVFDYIVSTSSFNLPLLHQDNYDFVESLLLNCYNHSRKGVSIDFLSSYVDFNSEEGFHYEPEKVFKIAKSISKSVKLVHDYPLFEFAIYLYKDFDGWSEK